MYLTKHELDNFISDCYIALVTEWFISWLVTSLILFFLILALDWCWCAWMLWMHGHAKWGVIMTMTWVSNFGVSLSTSSVSNKKGISWWHLWGVITTSECCCVCLLLDGVQTASLGCHGYIMMVHGNTPQDNSLHPFSIACSFESYYLFTGTSL